MPRTVGALDEQDLGDLLPSQLRRSRALSTPSHSRASAVLALAVEDLVGCGPVASHGKQAGARAAWRARMATDAADWIAADEPGVPYSFVSLCDLLGLNPDGIRRALRG